ncbi:cytochrome B [Rheinheimera riviphila]|uniref:Cytochrome B n=1 Tax=Rheinheimera riviphila TaxID=1834037 RepID=A0A437QIF1_9GAMM|nr:cytochrome b/b6 domain-containing protein [Rheinheimera riviphila]RVU34311.1 cytochrome B [Rheinheimera riviphila]
MQKSKIWDGAVRIFHWSQVLLLAGLWYSADQEWYGLHMTLAYTLAALLLSRLVWGVVGSENARFNHFVTSPRQAWLWLRHSPKRTVNGHNPLSGYMVLLMLTLILLQFVTGLMTSDDILTEGPLVALVPSAWVGIASTIHQWNINVILALVAVHIVAAIWHQWRGDKVITAMVTGNKLTAEKGEFKFRAVGLYLLLVLIIGGAFYLWQGDVVLEMLRSEWA